MRSSTLSLAAFAGLSSGLAIQERTTSQTGYYYMPTSFDSDVDSRVTAQMTFGCSDTESIKVVMDTGSANLWIWSHNATVHWGSPYLGVEGNCNVTVPTPYDPSLSTTSKIYNHTSTYAYAGNAKIVSGTQYVNDTLTAVNGNAPIPNTQIALENYGLFRISDDGRCSPISYDKGIMGLAPYDNTTAGPSFRQNLYDSGAIASKTIVLWLDKFHTVFANSTGGAIFGAIDTSKYVGELIEIENVVAENQIGIYVNKPNVTFNNGPTFVPDQDTTCLVDSGAHADSIPFDFMTSLSDQFLNSTGGILTQYAGVAAFNGSCEDIPDVNITYTFQGKEEGKSVNIDVPLRTYARGEQAPPDAGDICLLALEINDCLFGAPFLNGALVGLDDGDNSIWMAKGGVSEGGDGVNQGSLRVFGEGESFGSL